MATNMVPASSNLKRYFTLAGLGLTILGASYYLLKKSIKKSPNGASSLSKEVILKILSEIRRDLFPVLCDMAETYRLLLLEIGKKALPQETKHEVLTFTAKDEIEDVKEKITARYGVSLPDFNHFSKIVYKDDKDIKQMQDLISADIAQAMEGRLDLKATIPEFLTPKKLLEIYVEMLKGSFTEISNYLKELSQEKHYSFEDPVVVRKLQNLERDVRDRVSERAGIGGYEDHPQKITKYACSVFLKMDEDFRKRKCRLDTQYRDALKKVYQQDENIERIIAEFGKDVL